MHIFISDVHMTDAGVGGAVTDAQLVSFVEHALGIAKGKKVQLILVGDFFDLLRSSKWTKLWEEKRSAPWSGMSEGFKNFKGSYAETQAIEIAKTIAARYTGFSAILRRAVDDKMIEPAYVPGNHDFMFQLSPELRKVLVDFLGLSHDPRKSFNTTYQDNSASVFATHGNAFDVVNWHRQTDGYWAMGDAVVLRIVNRFPEEACREIGCAPETDIGQLLQEIDNIEPLADIPLYVRWLIDEHLRIRDRRKEVLKVWKRVVEEFLEISDFKDRAGYGRQAFQMVRYAFELSTKTALSKLIASVAQKFPDVGTDYRLAAEHEARKNTPYRFVVFGHTHSPMLQPLSFAPEGRTRFYVNTGCWRRLVTRTRGADPRSFAGRRVATFFAVDDTKGEDQEERYHLYQEWHAS